MVKAWGFGNDYGRMIDLQDLEHQDFIAILKHLKLLCAEDDIKTYRRTYPCEEITHLSLLGTTVWWLRLCIARHKYISSYQYFSLVIDCLLLIYDKQIVPLKLNQYKVLEDFNSWVYEISCEFINSEYGKQELVGRIDISQFGKSSFMDDLRFAISTIEADKELTKSLYPRSNSELASSIESDRIKGEALKCPIAEKNIEWKTRSIDMEDLFSL